MVMKYNCIQGQYWLNICSFFHEGSYLLRDNDPDREITETKMIYSRCNMQLDGQLISLMITESIY